MGRQAMFRREALILLAAAAVAGRADAADAPKTVRIGWLRGTNDITLSKARGTLERVLGEHGIGLEWAGPFPASAPAVEALNAGAIDITVGSSTSFVTTLAAGVPAVVFAYQRMGPDAEAIIVKKGSGIRAIRDLAGRSVAVNRGGTGEYLLVRALETNGVDPAGVKRVYLGPADAGSAFVSGAVDGWAIWDPFLTIALDSYDARVLANGPAIGSENAIVMIARTAFAQSERPTLRLIYEALEADNAWSVANQQAAGVIWADALKTPPAFAAAFGTHNAVPTIAAGQAQARQIAHIADWYVSNGIIATKPDVSGAVVDLSRP